MSALIFIDTNILLDFYRVRSTSGGLGLLGHIDNSHDRIITGSQVEMEYKKNRQKVILDSLKNLKNPEWAGLTVPSFLAQSKPVQGIETAKKDVAKQSLRIRKRIESVLKNPARYDPVFKVAQRLFRQGGELNLSRSNDKRYGIRRLAWKRFILGYPPRKDTDTSTGDAVNWEWIIHCAASTGRDVVIVSRDSDYGHSFQKDPILNDWLSQEFKERVSRRRKIILTDRLAEGFRAGAVSVTKKEAEAEEELLEEIRASDTERRVAGLDQFRQSLSQMRRSAAAVEELRESVARLKNPDLKPLRGLLFD